MRNYRQSIRYFRRRAANRPTVYVTKPGKLWFALLRDGGDTEIDLGERYNVDVRGEYHSADELIKAIQDSTGLFDSLLAEDAGYSSDRGGTFSASEMGDENGYGLSRDEYRLFEEDKLNKKVYMAYVDVPLENADGSVLTAEEAESFGIGICF